MNWSIWLILSAASAAPCFPDRASLSASWMYDELTPFTTDMELVAEGGPPSGSFGACSVSGGFVRSPDGALIAERHCGLEVYAPGIVDDLGAEVGRSGQVVRDALGPDARIACYPDYDGPGLRCYVTETSDEYATAHVYAVAGTIPDPCPGLTDDERSDRWDECRLELSGTAAWSALTSGKLLRLQVRGSCH